MDGLTISTQQGVLDTGRTQSELTRTKVRPHVPADGSESFSQSLNKAIGQVNTLQKTADQKMEDLATGRTDNIAEVMIAFAPGSVDAMMLLALALHLDPVYVGAHHVTRIFLVSLSLPFMARRIGQKKSVPTPPPRDPPTFQD